ncbi:MAG: protein translocase subunit SecD [Candidatus Zambryskibacteria bacterium]|nr:protein translocase subunit SecD [Candidatus Zambryskibacteria bacterium]
MKTRIISLLLIIISVLIAYFGYDYPFKLGLDLAGGTHLVYKADISKLDKSEVGSSMDALRDVIERRVNIFGVSEPIVQVEAGGILNNKETDQKLIVELPGESNVERAVASIGKTPLLEFRLVVKEDFSALASSTSATTSAQYFRPTGITGSLVEHAQLDFNQNSSEPVVSLAFNTEGKKLFAEITSENIGSVIAIFLDGNPISMPVVREAIRDGKAQISGNFTPDEAKALVRNLNYGALPVPIELISTQTVGASLGQDAVAGGVKAGIWSFVVIAIFLIIWYRLPGLLAVFSLMIYSILMLGIFKLVPVTLTAAGVAGFILSIGMAVDANILIFERMKEEFKRGRSLHDGIKEGFHRAWLSIRDSNLSSIITGVILYFLGSSSVIRGFALVFIIGVVVSMFTAITVSRTFLFAVVPRTGDRMKALFSNGLRK